jgi:hypothetical protein
MDLLDRAEGGGQRGRQVVPLQRSQALPQQPDVVFQVGRG